MLKRIKNFFEDIDSETNTPASKHTLEEKHLAAAALMVEAATLDGEFDADEKAAIENILSTHFKLSKEEGDQLLDEAIKRQEGSTHLLRFTKVVKDQYDEDERIELIEMMWEVVYADGHLHDYEANLLRRIGGLIYVSDRDRGDAKKRVLTKLGIDN
jgi:uncharacterized tellurite resistance protein B-like protein